MKKYIGDFILFNILLLLTTASYAQDLHYSHHIYNSLYYNPALTGYTPSKARLTASFADRYRQSFGKDGMKTIFGSADFNIPTKDAYVSNSNIGIGAYFYNHTLGGSALSENTAAVSVSYRLSLDKNNKHTLSAGFQGVFRSRKFNYDDLYFGNQFDGTNFNPNINSGENSDVKSESNFNAGLGILYAFSPNEIFRGYLGTSVFHLIPESNSVNSFSQVLRYNVHGGFEADAGNLSIQPSIMFDVQGKAAELYTGVLLKYFIQKTKNEQFSIYAGPYLRLYKSPVGDFSLYTVNIFAGIQFNNMQIFIAADNTINQAKQVFGGFNGFEVGLTVGFGKDNKNQQKLYCPVFR